MRVRLRILAIALLVLGMGFTGCKKEVKQGKVIVKDYKFTIRQDSPKAYVIDAQGTVKNVGDVDVKNIVVTGYCNSCGKQLVNGKWFVSDVPKTADQKAVISYLKPGQEASFRFKDVASMMVSAGEKPEKMPDDMVVKVVSFETVQK